MSDHGVSRAAVLGAGTMGHGIAQVSAMTGFETVLFDIDEAALEKGRAAIERNLDKGVQKGKVTEEARAEALGRLSFGTDLAAAVGGVQLVVEAAPERIDLKKKIFADISAACPEDAILGSNTSSLSLTEIAAAAKNPERVVGMHFFNPPHILKLLELVRAEQTSEESLARAHAIGLAMGREIITVTDTPGFATSRLGVVFGLEAMRMVEQGVASAADIDRAMELGYGHAMGPLRVSDLVGLDVRLAISERLHSELKDAQYAPPEILKRLVAEGKLGKKTGEGFHTWQ